ncbi:hypothetical protein V8G54_001166 [Vigna mungo]|uniref:DNA polymerase eta n=1 Tax=Vigna mungo TaxID=3915 RepID=A0AAQ3S9P4_VIGMU
MPVARRETCDARVIAHVDMDCFYVQVEQRKQPNLRGLPTAVIQYNSYKGGALIAVSYEARRCGVKRSMRGDEAKEACPQIQLVQVPVARGKADLNSYRNAGSEVVSVLSQKGRCERASIDEVYLDLTHAAETMLMETSPEGMQDFEEEVLKSHVLGLEIEDGSDAKEEVRKWLCRSDASYQDKLLACGALIVSDLRMQVLKETEFTCSAGIAHNKVKAVLMLAKLASAMNKPAQQTVVPHSSVEQLLATLPIKKMKHLGGKLGSSLQSDLGINSLYRTWLWNISRGINGEEVEGRLLPKSHGSGKTFPGPQALKTINSVQHWLNQLCEELNERLNSDLDQNKRIAQTLTLHARAYKTGDSDSLRKFPSKSCPLRYGTRKIQEDALIIFQAGLREFLDSYSFKVHGNENSNWGVTSLSVSASKIVSIPSGTHPIAKYFGGQFPSSSTSNPSKDVLIDEAVPSSPSGSENCTGMVPYDLQLQHPHYTEMKHSSACLDPQDPLNHLSSKAEGLTEESSFMSPSGSEDRMTGGEPHRVLPAKDPSHVSNVSSLKVVGKKRRAGKMLHTAPPPAPATPPLGEEPAFTDRNDSPSPSLFEPHSALPFTSGSSDSNLVAILVGVIGGVVFLVISIIGIYLGKTNKVATVKPWATGLSGQLQKACITVYKGTSSTDAGMNGCCGASVGNFNDTQLLEKCSIINIFNNYHNSRSSLEQKNVSKAHDIKISFGSQSADDSYSTCNEEIDTDKDGCSLGVSQGREAWSSYNIDEIDPSIIDELPPEIQQEFRNLLRPQKRPNVAKRGSSIKHYFLPDKSR